MNKEDMQALATFLKRQPDENFNPRDFDTPEGVDVNKMITDFLAENHDAS